jgi:hypothetical protein
MAHLWMWQESLEWVNVPLEAEAYDMESRPPRPIGAGTVTQQGARRVALVSVAPRGPAGSWVLVGRPGALIMVNGLPLLGGIRALRDRDEVRGPGPEHWFFSSELLARVEAFPGPGQVPCPRCRQPIEPQTPAVRCPDCRLWHHQTEALPCWTYGETCAQCHQATALDAGYRWTPAEV